jgi:hypothetical protein
MSLRLRAKILSVPNPALFAVPFAVILATLSLLHAYWALGGRRGRDYVAPVVQGKRSFNPTADIDRADTADKSVTGLVSRRTGDVNAADRADNPRVS